ncbi:MAG TPA: hypothetical protein VLJ79_28685, partial [Candidatus Binatia bacterium]|nr:hypothetical protein [Candidatus Binatia bacterium]
GKKSDQLSVNGERKVSGFGVQVSESEFVTDTRNPTPETSGVKEKRDEISFCENQYKRRDRGNHGWVQRHYPELVAGAEFEGERH